jgi:hypothetical protein
VRGACGHLYLPLASAANLRFKAKKQANIYLHKKALDDRPYLVCIEPI